MLEAILNFVTTCFLGLTLPKLILFCVFCLVMVIVAIVYKLSSNHLHHVEMSITKNTEALYHMSEKVVGAVQSMERTSRDEHMKQVEVLNRLLGRSDT
jgi:hypothetical protein